MDNAFYRYSATPVYSAVKAAAYITGSRVVDMRTGECFDFGHRRFRDREDVVDWRMWMKSDLSDYGGQPASDEPFRLETSGGSNVAVIKLNDFWNRVQKKNRRKRGVYARCIVASFPHGLQRGQMVEEANRYARYICLTYGVAVLVALHAPRRGPEEEFDGSDGLILKEPMTNGNWHAHFLISYCTVDIAGVLGRKQNALDPFSSRHHKLPNFCEVERPMWAEMMNAALQEVGRQERVDHRSLAARGSPAIPTVPLGPQRAALEARGITTALGDYNRAVVARNAWWRRRQLHASRLADVQEVLVKAHDDRNALLVRARSGRRAAWNLRILSNRVRSAVLYLDRSVGVIATSDGGRVVDLGDRYVVVDDGELGQVVEVLRERMVHAGQQLMGFSGTPEWAATVRAELNRTLRIRLVGAGLNLSDYALRALGTSIALTDKTQAVTGPSPSFFGLPSDNVRAATGAIQRIAAIENLGRPVPTLLADTAVGQELDRLLGVLAITPWTVEPLVDGPV